MTDREMLEFAAKAAGIDRIWYEWDMSGEWGLREREGTEGGLWNPLTDDGDALRLASCLLMDVKVRLKTVVAWASGGADVVEGYTDKKIPPARRPGGQRQPGATGRQPKRLLGKEQNPLSRPAPRQALTDLAVGLVPSQ